MLTWLGNLLGIITGAFKAIWDDLINIIRAVDGYLEHRIAQLWSGEERLYASLVSLSRAFTSFTSGYYFPFVIWVENTFNTLARRENDDYNRLVNFINDLSRKTSQQLTIVQDNASNGLAGLLEWVIKHVFDPLFGDITRILDWIAHEGAYLLNLLASADRLLAWILRYLFSRWPMLADKFGKLALAWFLRSWKSVLPVLVTIMEDIISAVLLGDCNAITSPVAHRDKARATSRDADGTGHGVRSLPSGIPEAQASHDDIPCHL